MNKLLGIVVPFSLLLTGGIWEQSQTYDAPAITMGTSPAAEIQEAAGDWPLTAAVVSTAAAVETVPLSPLLQFGAVNGIALSDDLKTIYELKGQPVSIIEDKILPSSRTYLFKDCEINVADGAIQNITVPATIGKVDIDGITFPFDKLKERLGMPFFVSEDGLVYKKGNYAFKIFLDVHDSHIQYVSYFHVGDQ
jgi:hypothetical protein